VCWDDNWGARGGRFSNTPTVIAWGKGRLDIFVVGWGAAAIWDRLSA
jgi:hypothetical protein